MTWDMEFALFIVLFLMPGRPSGWRNKTRMTRVEQAWAI